MAVEGEKKDLKTTENNQSGGRPKIVWDSSNMRSAYANVFNVSGTREEFVFFFGMNQSWDAGQQELKVQLTDRVVMSPFAAKRLATLLNNVMKDYESRYGAIEIEQTRPDSSILQ